jgi:hypothetical protein
MATVNYRCLLKIEPIIKHLDNNLQTSSLDKKVTQIKNLWNQCFANHF